MLPKFFLAENWTSSRPADQWINWKRLWSTKIWLRRWLNEINEKLWNWDKYVRYTDIHDKMYVYIKYMCIYIYMVKGACHTYHKCHVPINLLEAIFTIKDEWCHGFSLWEFLMVTWRHRAQDLWKNVGKLHLYLQTAFLQILFTRRKVLYLWSFWHAFHKLLPIHGGQIFASHLGVRSPLEFFGSRNALPGVWRSFHQSWLSGSNIPTQM